MAEAKSSGALGGLQDKAFAQIEKVLNVPEKAPVGWRRNVAVLSWNIGLSILVVAVLSLMFAGPTAILHPATLGGKVLHAFANPTFMSFSTMGMAVAIPGLLIGLGIQKVVPEKHHRTLAKIFAVVGSIVCVGAVAAITAHAGIITAAHGGAAFSLSNVTTNPFFIPIIMGVPLTAWTVTRSVRVLNQNNDERIV